MQYHYVIAFDDETKKWSLEDETRYLDGNVWDESDAEYGWTYPRDEREELIDERCRNMISVLATIWPAVDTEV